MKHFLVNLTIFTVVIALAFGSVTEFSGLVQHKLWMWLSIAFFTILTSLSFYSVIRATNMDHQAFIGRFLTLTIFRIILSGGFIAIYLIINAERDKAIVVATMLLYLFYTLFEIYHLVTKLRAEKNKPVVHAND